MYFRCLNRAGKTQRPFHIAAVFVFCYYLIGVLTMTGIGKLGSFSPTFVLIPFVDMIRGPVDTVLNLILFLPLGFFLPMLFKKYSHIRCVMLTSFFFSLSIEMVQMFGRGATDINDLITNTAGACLGYLIYHLLFMPAQNIPGKQFRAEKVNDIFEVVFLIVYAYLVMLTI